MGNLNIGGANFYISINNNEDSTWKGVIQRLDTGEKIHFRDSLELLNLIDQVVKSSKEPARRWGEVKIISLNEKSNLNSITEGIRSNI